MRGSEQLRELLQLVENLEVVDVNLASVWQKILEYHVMTMKSLI